MYKPKRTTSEHESSNLALSKARMTYDYFNTWHIFLVISVVNLKSESE